MERRTGMSTARALILRAPGINCDRETAHACRLAGFETQLLHINELIKQPQLLLDYHFLVIPGGFSYGDDLGAGTLLAKNLTIHLGEQLRQFIDEGRPVLGICNGFQALVRADLLPGSLDKADTQPIASLTNNASAQFECRWVTLTVQDSPCIFTRGINHPIELPVAHGEGQFVLANSALLAHCKQTGRYQSCILYIRGRHHPRLPRPCIPSSQRPRTPAPPQRRLSILTIPTALPAISRASATLAATSLA